MSDHKTGSRGDNRSAQITLDESMRQSLTFFEEALVSVCKSPVETYDDFGAHLGVSWEVRQEILSGKPLTDWSQLSDSKRKLIGAIVDLAEAMPEVAYSGSGLQDLFNPHWDLVRRVAIDFLKER